MSPYAKGTTVDPGKSRVEIERLLQRQACDRVGVMHEPGFATVYFTRQGWAVQMRIPLPIATIRVPARKTEQLTRERWRQLLLVLKAKFTALENGVETFEQSFMAHLVVGGEPLHQKILPAVAQAQKTGGRLLLGTGSSPG